MNDIKLKAKSRLADTEIDASTSLHTSENTAPQTQPVARLGNGGSRAVGLSAEPAVNAEAPNPMKVGAVARLKNAGSIANAVKAGKK